MGTIKPTGTYAGIALSGTYYIDDLLLSYALNPTPGHAATVRYAYASGFTTTILGKPLPDAGEMNLLQKNYMRTAMDAWEQVANIHFIRDESHPTLTVRQGDLQSLNAAGVYVTTSYNGDYASGNFTAVETGTVLMDTNLRDYTSVAMHELGHALGLKHPFMGPPFLPKEEDSFEATIMSYTDTALAGRNNVQGPQIYDIAAIQYLYGANYSYHAGNDTYRLSGADIAKTIWDGGGVDVLDASDYVFGGTILDLRSGLHNISQVGSGAYWIAFGANIENAIGTLHGDRIYGNALGNVLSGKAGADIIHGNAGSDIIYGGLGKDTLYGNQGNDTIYGGGDNATNPLDAADWIHGGSGDDFIYGNGGDDTINGGIGNDTLRGGNGNDTYLFGSTNGIDWIGNFDNPGKGKGDIIAIESGINGSSIDSVADVWAQTFFNAATKQYVIDLTHGNFIYLPVGLSGLSVHDFAIV